MKFNELIADSLNKVDDIIKRHHDWNEESKALGLISDSEKLKILKAELYCESRKTYVSDNSKQQRLIEAIEHLEEIKQSEFNRKLAEREQNLSLPSQLEATCKFINLLALALVIISYLGSYTCGNSRSQFCSNARLIPTQVELFFKD